MKSIFSQVSREISRIVTPIWQSLSILGKVLISIPLTIMILCLFSLTFPILLTLVVSIIPLMFLVNRWFFILTSGRRYVQFSAGDMKVPTFYSTVASHGKNGDEAVYFFLMSTVGVVFGGMHCAGWFRVFYFPSSDEATMWQVSSRVLTGIAFLLPLVFLSRRHHDPVTTWLSTASLCYFCFSNHRICTIMSYFVSRRFHLP